ncbi:MAG TPA: glycosyltransferase family 4 protein [Acidimicrobiales bacterium]|nr:glycosyltransferase family 4 protein [Acidimicrobiales bacterium]
MTNSLAIGGIETNVVRLSRELTDRGHRVSVAARAGELVPELIEAGGRFLPLDTRPINASAGARQLRKLVARSEPDIVHSFSAAASLLTRLALTGLRSRPPVVSTVMGLQSRPGEGKTLTGVRVWATSVGADRVVIVSPAIRQITSRLPISQHRLVEGQVVGVDLPDLAERSQMRVRARAAVGTADDTRVVLTIGNLEPRKSHELFIRAADQVRRALPDTVFLIVGGGHLESLIREEISRLDLIDHVRMLGPRTDADDLIWAADVYVRPGVVEGFVGITVLEAQARGVPVISFETEDVKLAIEDGVSGLLAARGDVGDLAGQVIDLLGDPARASMIGSAGRRAVEMRFALPAIVDRLLDLYGSLGAPNRSPR